MYVDNSLTAASITSTCLNYAATYASIVTNYLYNFLYIHPSQSDMASYISTATT